MLRSPLDTTTGSGHGQVPSTRLTERIAMGFGLSTGGVSNDSGNQTLGDGFSRKPVGLDLAYFDWSLSEQLNLVGGKMVNPFFRPGRHHLLYDDDLRPEGLALSVDSGRFFGNASVYWAEERALGPDSLWLGIQAGFRGPISEGLAYTAAAGFYEITNTRGRLPIFTPLGGQGNLLDSNGGYLYGFSQAELSGELEIDVYGYPVTLFLDYVTNTAADRTQADGIAFGLGYQRRFRSQKLACFLCISGFRCQRGRGRVYRLGILGAERLILADTSSALDTGFPAGGVSHCATSIRSGEKRLIFLEITGDCRRTSFFATELEKASS